MTMRLPGARLALLACLTVFPASAQTPPSQHSFRVSGNQFLLDGKPFQILSGSMHYTRVPRAEWRDRFRKARAMGLNAITTYVFWNVHEPRPGVFDFSGQNDIAEYIREAQQEGLYVILRPGPYVCAEWDLGGFPSWLLKDRSLVLRSSDPKYMAAVQTWFRRLGKEIHPLLLQNGGPILAIQVENEYGSFGDDHAYMEAIKEALVQSGMNAPVLYTADGPEELPKGSLPELPAVINFGTGDAHQAFATLARLRPTGPRMSGEYWDGWFDHWGEKHHVTDGRKEAAELAWMIRQGDSVSLYMFEGGTSFGWMNGANSNGSTYEPDTTSYDYDAPLDERGQPRDKYFLFRDAIRQATGVVPRPVPAEAATHTFRVRPGFQTASLWSNLPRPVESDHLLTMEDLDQSYGYILYRTTLGPGDGGELAIGGLHDYAQIYLNHKLAGTLDRRLNTDRLALPVLKTPAILDILVENSGRVNFTRVIRTERKGIVGSVTVGSRTPQHWQIYSLPMDQLSRLHFETAPCSGPCFYRTAMEVDQPADTYIDASALHKGEMWIGDRPLGRFWSIGPQYALFTPGSWLRKGTNTVTFFDLQGSAADRVTTVRGPIFDRPAGAKELQPAN